IENIKKVYERYGFVPLDTPVLELLECLIGTGGEETNKQLFRLESPENEATAMRFDLTVPFARLLAQYPEKLKLPFRRYHIGPVFRADKPSPGRFRQFTQFDIDAAGSLSVAVDAEIIAAMCEVLKALGLQNSASVQEYLIKVSNRKLLDALLAGYGIEKIDIQKSVLRTVDKLAKVGIHNVRKELGPGRVDESGDPIRGVGLKTAEIDGILNFIAVSAPSRPETIEALKTELPSSEISEQAIAEMLELAGCLDALGVAQTDVVFAPDLTRGLDYYSGPVYEAFLPQAPELGSVMGGGRFDHLVSRFMDTAIPATGASIGIDRLCAGLQMLGKLEQIQTTTKVLVVSIGKVPPDALLEIAAELRNAGIPTEPYFGKKKPSLRNQLAIANTRQIPVAVILGEDEYKNNQVAIKDLQTGAEMRKDIDDHTEYRKKGKSGQQTIKRNQLVDTVKNILTP
ncbi:MAG: histidine--tRNA ligase, partial [Planctomycetota bacterium]